MSTTTIEDFTFHVITTTAAAASPPPCLIDSPPLWHPSFSTPSSSSKAIADKQRRSFSYVERGNNKGDILISDGADDDEDDDQDHEKMDMLWEDLNEEFSKRCGSELEFDKSRDRFVQIGCVRGAPVVKKPGTVAFLKVLKKLFLIHSFQRSVKKRRY